MESRFAHEGKEKCSEAVWNVKGNERKEVNRFSKEGSLNVNSILRGLKEMQILLKLFLFLFSSLKV